MVSEYLKSSGVGGAGGGGGGGGGEGALLGVNFCWVCAAGLSEPLDLIC